MPRTQLPDSAASLQSARSPKHTWSRNEIENPGTSATAITKKGGEIDQASSGQADSTPTAASPRMPLRDSPLDGGSNTDVDSSSPMYSPPPSAFEPMAIPDFERHISEFQRYALWDLRGHDKPSPNAKSEDTFEESPPVLHRSKPGSTALTVVEPSPGSTQPHGEASPPSGSPENFLLPPTVTLRRPQKYTKEASCSSPGLPQVPNNNISGRSSTPVLAWCSSPDAEESPSVPRNELERPGQPRQFFPPLVGSPVQWGGTSTEDAGDSDSSGEEEVAPARASPPVLRSALRRTTQDRPLLQCRTNRLGTVLEGDESAETTFGCRSGSPLRSDTLKPTELFLHLSALEGERFEEVREPTLEDTTINTSPESLFWHDKKEEPSHWKGPMSDSLLSFERHEAEFAPEEESMPA